MGRINASILLDKLLKLEQKSDEEIKNFFEKWVKEYKCWKYNKGDLALTLLNILSEGERIRAVFYTGYRVPKGLSLFVSDIFEGHYPYRVAYLKYKTWTGATWIDLIIRPTKGYGKTDYVYFVRVGIEKDGTPVDEDVFRELVDFVGTG